MNEYIIVRAESLYKIYRRTPDNQNVYQYAGATFVMMRDAEDFIQLRNGDHAA